MKIYTLKQFIDLKHEYDCKDSTMPSSYVPKTKYALTKTKVLKPAKTLTKTTHIGTPQVIELEPAKKTVIDNTNQITKLIVDYFKVVHGSSSIRRISSEGKWRQGIGFIRSENKGLSDAEGIILGKYWSIELKVGKDKQQASQKKREQEIRKDGGVYWLLKWKGFELFQQEFYQILNQSK